MDSSQALVALGALAEPTRLAMLRRLVEAGAEGMPAGGIGDAVGATPSRLSFHLSALDKAGLVTSSRHAPHIL